VILRNRSIAALLGAETISSLGTQMTWLALPWFVLVTTGSPSRMGIVFAAEVAPMAVLGIASGGVVQRLGARRSMLVSDFARAPLIALVPVLHRAGVLSFGLIVALVALAGLFTVPYFSSQRLILPEVLGDDEQAVTQANSLFEATRITAFVGPAVAGVLIGAIGATNVLWIDAGTYLVSFALVSGLVPQRAPTPPAEEAQGLLAGVRYLFRDRLLAPTALTSFLFGFFFPVLMATLPVLAYRRYDQDARVAGWLVAALGAGSLLGSIAGFQLATKVGPFKLARATMAGLVPVFWILLLHLPATGVGAVIFAIGFALPLLNAPLLAVLTVRTPEALRPKVMTALISINTLLGPLGYAVVGPLVGGLGLAWTYGMIAAGSTAAGIVFLVGTLNADRVTMPVMAGEEAS
jgi:MFS family permease